jgi:glutathione S-transferase
MRALHVTTSWLASAARLGFGMFTGELGARPEKPLVLYEFEACPFCRRVREALTILDLAVEIRPCPKGGTRFRPEAVARSGRSQFPFLVDPNTEVELLESGDIIEYLFATYGSGGAPLSLSLPLFITSSQLSTAFRITRGRAARPSIQPEQPLELYGYEASPYVRLAREALCELELPYIALPVGKGSPRREEFVQRSGRMMVPWLHDPNTGRGMHESGDIVAYLNETYAA